MKKLLFLLLLLIPLACTKPDAECGVCHHITTYWNETGMWTQEWGEFTACGDTLRLAEGYVYRITKDDGLGYEAIDITFCVRGY